MAALAALLACSAGPGADQSACEDCSTSGPFIEEALEVSVVPLASGTGQIEYRLTNHSDRPLRVLPRETALSAAADAFEVLFDGAPADYMGDDVYWGPPKREHLVEIAPGAALSKTVDLTALYDMSGTGTYAVRARALAGTTLGSETPKVGWAAPAGGGESQQVFVNVDAEHRSTPAAEADAIDKAIFPSNSGCSQFIQGIITMDQNRALGYLNDINDYSYDLINNPTSHSQQVLGQHFSPIDQSARQFIFDTYYYISQNLTNTTYFCRSETHPDCSGEHAGASALTQPSSSTVRLCPHYFDVVSTSRSRILIHEASHQHRNSTSGEGTLDRYTTKSIHNAYSYEGYSMKCYEGTCYP